MRGHLRYTNSFLGGCISRIVQVKLHWHSVSQILKFAAFIPQPVRCCIELSHRLLYHSYETSSRLRLLPMAAFHALPRRSALVTAQLPEHATSQTLSRDVLALPS